MSIGNVAQRFAPDFVQSAQNLKFASLRQTTKRRKKRTLVLRPEFITKSGVKAKVFGEVEELPCGEVGGLPHFTCIEVGDDDRLAEAVALPEEVTNCLISRTPRRATACANGGAKVILNSEHRDNPQVCILPRGVPH